MDLERLRILGVLALVLLGVAAARAQPPEETRVELDGVEVVGQRHFSSVETPREPRLLLTNGSSEPRTVVVDALFGLDGSTPVPLALRGERSFTLAPGESRRVTIDFDGRAPQATPGLSHQRFRVDVSVGRARGEVRASVGYMCRIPSRR